jgi:hypothetical protein
MQRLKTWQLWVFVIVCFPVWILYFTVCLPIWSGTTVLREAYTELRWRRERPQYAHLLDNLENEK